MILFPNLGNTCYCSSVLQCFINNKHFIKIINDNKHSHELIQELYKIINSNNKEYSLLTLLKIINSKKPWFKCFEQNDAHEFLILFLDIIQNILKNSINNKEYSRKEFLKDNNKLLIKSYYGEMVSVIKCNNCNKINKSYSEFNSIHLNIPCEKREYSLSELFALFLSEENNINYNCEFCITEDKNIQNNQNTKKESINILPNNLIIVLNRYSSNGLKNNQNIKIPLILLIKEKKTGNIKEYSLTGVINHFGLLLSGHYNTIIIDNNDYYLIDDNSLTKFNNNHNNELSSRNCYILFYSIKE
jgi:ubiquitin C-terminal hydrolase